MAIGTWFADIFFFLGAAGLVFLAWWLRLRWPVALVLRVVLLVLLVAAYFGAREPIVMPRFPEILIVDLSDSVPEQVRFDARVFATAWKEARENREVLVFGETADAALSDDWPEPAFGGSDLNSALELAEDLLGGKPGKLLVMTDGLVQTPLALQETLWRIQTDGVETELIRMDTQTYQNDVSMGGVLGAASVWEGNQFTLRVPVYVPGEIERVTASIQAFVNGTAVTTSIELRLNSGENLVDIPLQAGSAGVMGIEIRVDAPDDEFLGNNVAYASVEVYPKPRVLFVTNDESQATNLVRRLADEEITVEIVLPGEIPVTVAGLDDYQAVILHNLLAQDLTLEQMKNIQLQVVDKGKGLVFLGGRNSYTLGGYQNTIFGPILPVVMAPPDRVQRVPITFLLVLDRSGSMSGDRFTSIAPIDLTREGAMRAIETLRSDDYLGVITFSGVTSWEVDIRPVGDGLALREAQDRVSRIEAFGGTLMYNALDTAVAALMDTETTDYPHILLMSDGESADGSEDEFVRLAQEAQRHGITVSTIALGAESDLERLSAIAAAGGGRFYRVMNPVDLPEVMISESRAIQAENIQEGVTNLVLEIDGHPILSEIRLDNLPRLNAYTALKSKAALGAEDVLISGNFGDPILSVWQVGLGHVAAWMGDIGENWAPEMNTWSEQGQFWAQVVRYTMPSPTFGESYVSIEENGTDMIINLAFDPDATGNAPTNAPLIALASPAGDVSTYRFTQTGAGSYSLVFDKPETAAYAGVIQYSVDGEQRQLLAPFAVNYPAEWQFAGEEEAQAAFEALVETSGGTETTTETALIGVEQVTSQMEIDWTTLLLILLVITWPAEIAIRRWQMPWRRP